MRIGPFSYEPMRAVDIWLQQSDDFLLQSLSSVPEVVPPHFVQQLRTTLKRIKDDPYPAVTIFNTNKYVQGYFNFFTHFAITIFLFLVQDITEKTHHQDIGLEFIIKKNQTILWQHQLWHQLVGILQQCQALPIPKLTIDRNDS